MGPKPETQAPKGTKDKQANKQGSSQISGNSLKEREKRKKQIFKPVLDNPYTQVSWPFIKPSTSEDIISLLVNTLKPIGVYNEVVKRSKTDKTVKTPQKPDILDQVKIGFNPTTAALEESAKKNPDTFPIEYVFICKYDIPAKMIVQHFPVLTYTASKGAQRSIKLIQLPKGSAQTISDALNVPNTTILGVSKNSPLSNTDIFKEIPDIDVPYLKHGSPLNKPRINFLATSAPIISKQKKQKESQDSNATKEPPAKKQKTKQ